jgi:hypothetical protein
MNNTGTPSTNVFINDPLLMVSEGQQKPPPGLISEPRMLHITSINNSTAPRTGITTTGITTTGITTTGITTTGITTTGVTPTREACQNSQSSQSNHTINSSHVCRDVPDTINQSTGIRHTVSNNHTNLSHHIIRRRCRGKC